MRKIKSENVFAVAALVGILLLFAYFLFDGATWLMALLAVFATLLVVGITVIARLVRKHIALHRAVLGAIACCLFCSVLFAGALFHAEAETLSLSGFPYSEYFSASYTVASTTGTATVDGNKINITATGVDSSKSGCDTVPAVSSTTTVTLKANKTVAVTYSYTNATISPPATPTDNGDGTYTVIVPQDSELKASVTASNATKVSGSITITDVQAATTKVPADCAVYLYNGGYYNYFDKVLEAANSSGGTISVVKSGTVYHSSVETDDNYTGKSFTYVIPGNVTLLVPFDEANTLYTTAPGTDTAYSTPTIFRVLTIPSGTNITVANGGAISLSAKQTAYMPYNGAPTGALSRVDMANGSSITVQSGGTLYCWGVITGFGHVIMESGSTVYQDFQAIGWRGGNYTNGMKSNSQKVFPMNQYYFQNVQVPLTIHSGALMNCQTAMDVSVVGTQTPSFTVVGKDTGLFRITSGSITFDYLEDEDRTHVAVDGVADMSNIKISMNLGILGSVTIDSAKFVLPLMQSMSLTINGTVNLLYDMAILPGTRVTISETGKVDLKNGANLYVYDSAEWGGYCGSTDLTYMPAPWVCERKYTFGNADLVDGVLEVNGLLDSSGGYLYTTQSGAAVISSGGGKVILSLGSAKVTYQVAQVADQYVEIPITQARLKNADGTYIQSAANTYTYKDGKWICESRHTAVAPNHACTVCGFETACEDTDQNWVCDICGAEIICEHDWKAATCTVAKTCKICGTTEGQANGHGGGTNTCTAKATCSVCGEQYGEYAPHVFTNKASDKVKKPEGCVTNAVYYAQCDNCSKISDTATVEIPNTATGHIEYREWEVITTANCTEDGSRWRQCICGHEETEVIPATGHTPGAVVVENKTEADCTNDGSYDNVVYCTVCNDEVSREPVEDKALGHTAGDVVVENEVTADCVNDGSYDNVVYCTVCGEELSRENVLVKALGHTEGDVVVENNTAASCGKAGSYDNVVYCTVCNVELSRESQTVDKVPHTPGAAVIENELEATCTTEGSYESVVYCSVCNAELSRETVAVDALPHTEGEAFVDQESKVDATCGADGSYDTVVCCSVCGKELSRVTEAVAATGKHYDSDDDEDEDCDVCGNPMEVFNITFVGYYGDERTVSVMYGKKVPFPELSEELTTTTFVLRLAGWKLQTEDGLVDVDPGVTATGDAIYVCNYEIVEAKFPPLMSVEYGSQEENVVMYVQLFVYADTNGLIQPVVEIVKPDTADALVGPLNVVEGRKQTVYMYKIAMTATDISDPNRVIRITLGNYTQEITEAVSKYTDALANAGLIQDQFNTNIPKDVLDAQDVLINEMLAYGNNVQLYFKGNEAVLKPGQTEAFPIIDSTTMKEYETLYNTADPQFIMNTDAVETDFRGATVNFNEVLGLYFFYNVTLKVPGTITEKGIIISGAELSDQVKSKPFDAQEHPDMIYVEAGTNTQTDKVPDAAYMSGADGMTVNDIEDKYITIYVEYEDEDGTHVVYGTYMIYGIRRYVQKQIYKYSPTGKGDTVAAQNEKNPNATKRYVNLLDSILRVNDSAAALEKAKNDAAVAPTE